MKETKKKPSKIDVKKELLRSAKSVLGGVAAGGAASQTVGRVGVAAMGKAFAVTPLGWLVIGAVAGGAIYAISRAWNHEDENEAEESAHEENETEEIIDAEIVGEDQPDETHAKE